MHKRNMLDAFFVSTFLLSVLMINVSKVEAAATTQVSVVPSQLTVGNPDVQLPTPLFTINITVQDVTDLYAWQIYLYYNSTILYHNSTIIPTENIFKGKDYFPIGPYIEVDSNGTYIVIGATLVKKVPGVTGSGVLCQINFAGQATGTSQLNLADKTETTQHGDYTFLLAKSNSDLVEIDDVSIVDGQVTVIGIEDPREPSKITINVNPSTVKVGSNVTITGTINLTRVGVDVTIYYVPALGTQGTLAKVQTKEFNATHCRYEYNWTTDEAGEYTLFASWPGDADYRPATSNSEPVTVTKWSSTISINVYPIKVAVGSSVIINGTISTPKPVLPYEKVTISYRRAGGDWIALPTVSPGEDGVYTYTWETSETGSYDLKASWPGDKYSDSAYSIELTVEVTGESMAYLYYIIAAIAIIAIATIGIYFAKIKKR